MGNRKKRKKTLLLSKILLVFTSFTIIILVSSFIYISNQIPPYIEDVKNIELYDSDDELYLSMSNGQKKTWTNLEDIGDYLIDSFISIEDKKYYKHSGFDIERILKACFKNLKSSKIQEGASTITQQYARNMFLTFDQTFSRKIQELIYAIQLENNYTKDEILEGYLNNIYFGHGIYGIYDASMFYFEKEPKKLSLAQAAVIAAIAKGPTYYSPLNNFELNKKRKELILKELLSDKKIDNIDYATALEEEIKIICKNRNNEYTSAPYFQDSVIAELKQLDIPDMKKSLGLKVYTTLDKQVNEFAIKAIDSRIAKDTELQASIIVMNPSTGDVLTVIGGRDYEKSTYNRALNANRQPASTVKPFLYYEALEYGFTPTTTFMSAPTTFYVNNGKDKYAPTNFGSIYPYQDVSMAYALATSDNIYAVKSHLIIGEDKLSSRLNSLGLHSQALPSLALGTSETTLETMANAYAHLANGGYSVTPNYITKITDSKDNVLYERKNKQVRVLSEDNTYILNELMTGTFDTRLAINISVTGASIANHITNKYAAKTGSTDFDNWIFGYTPDLLVGVWSGYDKNIEITSQIERQVPKYIWLDIMESYFKDKDATWYNMPSNVKPYMVDPITGNFPEPNTYLKKIYYKKGTEPSYLW